MKHRTLKKDERNHEPHFYITEKGDKMPSWKETERYAFIALIIYFFFRFIYFYFTTYFSKAIGMEGSGVAYFVLYTGIPMLCNVGFGHWLSALNRGRGYMRTIWFVFGFLFGLTGVGLFYILKLFEHLKNTESYGVQQAV